MEISLSVYKIGASSLVIGGLNAVAEGSALAVFMGLSKDCACEPRHNFFMAAGGVLRAACARPGPRFCTHERIRASRARLGGVLRATHVYQPLLWACFGVLSGVAVGGQAAWVAAANSTGRRTPPPPRPPPAGMPLRAHFAHGEGNGHA
jgi:hypothetical protein